MDIYQALCKLMDERRVFVSEADFQLSLAWAIQQLNPTSRIRLEYTPWEVDARIRLDIVVLEGDNMYPIELKYPTKKFDEVVGGERIRLKDQAAHDITRYDFLKDIKRMEAIVACKSYSIPAAYAILLTNAPTYWTLPRMDRKMKTPIDAEFRIHEGVHLSGTRQWHANAGAGTTAEREAPIELRGEYIVHWNDYRPEPQCLFMYTVIEVKP